MRVPPGPVAPDPRIPAALCGAPPPERESKATAEPLRYCVFATVALLTWVFGPVVVAALAGLGLFAYRRVRTRRGPTRCLLGDVRLVLAYLTVVFVVAVAATLHGVVW